ETMATPSPTHSDGSGSSKHLRNQVRDSWEIVEGFRGVPASMREPDRQEGFLLKRRKWPMKGWHKRGADLQKGKLHGCIDVGLSVMSIKKKAMCIDLDTEDNIYHLKVKAPELFEEWVSKLRHHRVFRQNEIAMYPHESPLFSPHASSSPSFGDSLRKVSCRVLDLTQSATRLCDVAEARRPLVSLSLPHRGPLSPIHTSLKSAFSSLVAERDRMRRTIDRQAPQPAQVVGLKTAYASVSGTPPQNKVCATRQLRCSFTQVTCYYQECPGGSHSLVHQLSNESKASISESISEFFDAQEYLLSSSSSENEVRHYMLSALTPARRRSTLPSTSPTSSVSLWNILKNNIGKDLSKVAMPVQLNEPLNTLQRLCEELEYSELLDTANHTRDPYQRMVYVATFAITAYASTYHRAGSKPFNPVLGETYECDRPDKSFRFIAEQVSHHPPVSACHSDSRNFAFWQDVRWKNKFWGKSMEIVPMGTTHVTLPAFGDHYEWNKVTSCIHNILSGQRWIEHYGEMSIKNRNSEACQCKVTFVKARSWSSTVNEIEGVVTDSNGKVVHSIFGKWHESVFQGDPPLATCIWRANPMPVNQDQYYGFTQFAVELNELDSPLRPLLPPTDTRFRPDQRLLEEGNTEGAEEQKQRIERLQRERRKVLQDNNMTHQPRFFKKSDNDTWVSNNAYWELRRDPGFSQIDFPLLW
uniref:Oxysterol-binding protein n=1 Tax=Gasterosteus aculeatus aculeatus TaxID=481459 RepID=A0AAQ4R6N9_GASAC